MTIAIVEEMDTNTKKKGFQLKSTKRGGESLVEYKPLFTRDSKKLIIIALNSIKIYNISGGQLLQELNGHNHKVIGLDYHPNDKDAFISCDEKGFLVVWKLGSSTAWKKYRLSMYKNNFELKHVCFREGSDRLLVTSGNQKDGTGMLSIYSSFESEAKPLCLTTGVFVGSNTIAIGHSGNYVVALKKQCLYIRQLDSASKGKSLRHKSGAREMVSLAAHPNEEMIATGDDSGRIILWYNIFTMTPAKKILHWHTLAVVDLVFSYTGNELYSGGKESVVVRWQLTEDRRCFLPRVGMPICTLSADTTNSYVVAGQVDNSLTIIGGREWKREGIIQGLAVDVGDFANHESFLISHPTTRSLIMGANRGHIQFYDIHACRQLFRLDITMRNYITEERNTKLPNLDVRHAAISNHGVWLVTFEATYPKGGSFHDYRLKFWQFKNDLQRWYLNTSIDMPHNVYIDGIDLQNTSSKEENPYCVTHSIDGKFKLWKTIDDTNIHRENVCWNCHGVGEYHDMPLQTAVFTPDGSMLAAAFNSSLTLWSPNECEIRGVLSQPYLAETIKQIVFGNCEGNLHFVITRTASWLCCWDLLSCSLSWRAYISTFCLVPDPASGTIAGFTMQKGVFMFEPKSSLPFYWQKDCMKSNVVNAAFIPDAADSAQIKPWGSSNVLCYLDTDSCLNILNVDETENELVNGIEEMEVDDSQDIQIHNVSKDPVDRTNVLYSALISRSKNIETKAQNDADHLCKLSSDRYLTNILASLSVQHIDSFETITTQFCNMIIPSSIEMEETSTPLSADQQNTDAKISTKNNKMSQKKIFEKIEKTDFDRVVSIFKS